MIDSGKISAFQMGKMIYLAIIPTAVLTAPVITFKLAKQDLWLSPVWAFSGLVAGFVALQLHRLYPGQNLVQVFECLAGRFLGKIIGLAYWLYLLYVCGIIVREYGEFVVGALLLDTPPIVVLSSMVLVCTLAVRGGVEIVGRFSDILLPAFIILFLLILIPVLPDLRVTNIMPVMGEGIMPSIEGAYVLQIWYSELMLASFLLPFVNDGQKKAKSVWLVLLAIIFTLVVSDLMTLMLLGELSGNYAYPFLILARYINLADFFTHLEALFMAIWVLGAFVKICVFYYVTVLVAAQWMNLSDYRQIVLPLGFLLTLFSIWVAPNYPTLIHAISTSIVFLMLTMFVVIPFLLLVAAWVKQRLRGTPGKK